MKNDGGQTTEDGNMVLEAAHRSPFLGHLSVFST
jgi:hypothetical protein